MGNSGNLIQRLPRKFIKTITFVNGAGTGAIGTVALFTVVGSIFIERLTARCLTSLAGATATVEVGVAGNTAGLIALTTGTDIDDGDWWHDAGPEVGIGTPILNRSVEGNIIITVATANLTAGAIEFEGFYYPISADGNLAE